MPKFNQVYDFTFEVLSGEDDAADVTAAMLRSALLERVNRLTDDELLGAVCWFDSIEVEDK